MEVFSYNNGEGPVGTCVWICVLFSTFIGKLSGNQNIIWKRSKWGGDAE